MSSLAEMTAHVIGIDPCRDHIDAAIVRSGDLGVIDAERFDARPGGYDEAVSWADGFSDPARRAWVIEGSGSYGAGLCRALRAVGELVVEFSFPAGPAAPDGSKNDQLDAVRAAREALGRGVVVEPRNADGVSGSITAVLRARELMVTQRTQTINAMKALMLRCPDELRTKLRGLSNTVLVATCCRFRPNGDVLDDVAATKHALKAQAVVYQQLSEEIAELTKTLEAQVTIAAGHLLDEHGVGVVSAAEVIVAWSHPGRIRSEAAFAKLAGVAPVEATSGQTQTRHRLCRKGNRKLNAAIYRIVITRERSDPRTRAYVNKSTTEGKTRRETRRKLKRYVARDLYKLLENGPKTPLDRT